MAWRGVDFFSAGRPNRGENGSRLFDQVNESRYTDRFFEVKMINFRQKNKGFCSGVVNRRCCRRAIGLEKRKADERVDASLMKVF